MAAPTEANGGSMTDPDSLADAFVAMWNEPDPDRRRAAVRGLWSDDALQVVRAPEDLRARADELGLDATLRARGHDALEERVRRAYAEFVEPGTTCSGGPVTRCGSTT